MSDDDRPRAIDQEMWSARTFETASIVGDLALGIDTWSSGQGVQGRYNSHYISVAGECQDGRTLVEVVHEQEGEMGLEDKIAQAIERYSPIVVAWDDGAAHALAPIVTRVVGDNKHLLKPLRGRDWSTACAAFLTAVKEDRLCHLNQDWMTFAVEGVGRKHRGESWVWDRLTATSDISPLCASTAAHWAIESHTPTDEEEFYVY